MDEIPGLPLAPDTAVVAPTLALPRWLAALEVLVVCGIPTQLFLATLLVYAGMPMFAGARTSLEFFATLSLLDTALVALLIRLFLTLSGENSQDVFIGRRPVIGEIGRGLLLLPVVFVAVTVVILALRGLAPWLHNVRESPFEAFIDSPFDAAIFAVVVILAGGVREELQRAFILHRFDQRLGGAWVGLAVFSMTFGALHLDQGLDVALAIGLLGVVWGTLYIRRGSVVASMVNHAGFDAAQIVQQVIARAVGL